MQVTRSGRHHGNAMLTFRGTCGHEVQVPDELAGRAVRCPYCHTVLLAPEAVPYAMPVPGQVSPPRGLVAVELRQSTPLKILYLDEGKARSVYEAARFVVDHAGTWSILPLLPFLALRWRSSLLVTLVASAVLAGFLWVFFSLIFPAL